MGLSQRLGRIAQRLGKWLPGTLRLCHVSEGFREGLAEGHQLLHPSPEGAVFSWQLCCHSKLHAEEL